MGKFLLSTLLLLTTVFATTAETVSFANGLPSDWQKSGGTIQKQSGRVGKDCLQLQKNATITSPKYLNVSEITLSLNISSNATTFTIAQSLDNQDWTTLKTINKADCSTSAWKDFTINTQGDTSNGVYFKLTSTGSSYYISEFKYIAAASGPIDPEYEIVPNEITLEIGEEESFPKISPTELNYTFSTTDNSIIEINNESKKIKGLSIGTAIVNFSTDKVEGKYNIGSGSFKVNVVGKTPQMSFANASVYGKVNTGVVWQQVTVVEPTENAGAISYSSSDPEIVTIDATTGRIRPEDVKKAGVATITAIMAPKGDYAEGTASYLIVVIDPNAQIQPDHTVFDFTTEDPYGMTTQNGGSAYEQNIKSIPGENETVTLSFTGNYRSYNSSSAPYHLRLQKGAKLTITVPEGYKITKIGITGSNIKGTYDPASGTNADLTDPDGGTFSYVWIPQEAAGAVRSITYTSPSGSSADPTQIKKINVMWDAADSELKPVQLTFTPNVNGIYVNEEALINAVNNPKGRVITYSIPALDPEPGTETSESENQPKKYSIEEIDGKLKVRVTEPGSYTLEARSVGGDGFRDGFAIMRLNVYRHLAVYANEVALEEDVIDTGSGETEVTIDVPESANLYYRFENSTTPETVAENESDDENMLEGYTLYEDGITVPAKTAGTLNFYIANYGYLSPIRKITLSFETGVEEIENAANGVVRIFDLNGREIKGTPEKGVYIRIQNGKATKVVI